MKSRETTRAKTTVFSVSKE